MRALQIDGHTLAAIPLNSQTSGELTILLHGVNLSPRFWMTDETFSSHGPCYSLTLPGHYPATFPNRTVHVSLSADLFTQLLIPAIRQLSDGRPVTLAGISTGGFSALAVAARAPELVRRVVCISGFAEGRWSGLLGRYQTWARGDTASYSLFRLVYVLSRLGKRSFQRNVWPYFVADRSAFYNYPRLDELMNYVYADWTHLQMETVLAYHRDMPDISITDWLPQISAPTLVLHGQDDPVVPPAQAQLIASLVPHAELVMVPGAGHMLFAERPSLYRTTVSSWLEKTTCPELALYG